MAVEIIAASAGSGKTFRLAEVLEQALLSGEARPEAVLATTFTRSAAAELKERVRRRLLAAGHVSLAQRLTAARIGTVNAVCARLVSDFAIDLGLSPRLQTIDEGAASSALNRALSLVLHDRELSALAALGSRIDGFDWNDAIKRVVDLARTNGIGPERLAQCAARSCETFAALWPEPDVDGAAIDGELLRSLETFVEAVARRSGVGRTTREAAQLAARAIRRLQGGLPLSWHGWAKLAILPTGDPESHLAQAVRQVAAGHERHPQLRTDSREAITLVFALAARVLASYQQLKTDWGVIDYPDQEWLALSLLRNGEIRQQLGDGIDLVLVDEFQDTTPIQLAIFLKLSELAKRSVWVGDQKQAIYGFRGSDPALMDATIAALVGDDEPETLSRSFRSRAELVTLTSTLFSRAFEKHGLPPQRVMLAPTLAPNADLGPCVEFWELLPRSKSRQAVALATALREFLEDASSLVRDPSTGVPRAPQPGDIAVLCRHNWASRAVAEALRVVQIPVVTAEPGLSATAEGHALVAALRLWVGPENRLAAAELLRLLGEGPAEATLRVWLGPDASGTDHEPLRRLLAFRQRCGQLGLLELVDALVDELDLRRVVAAWGDQPQRQANLDALRELAVRYAAPAEEAGQAATVAGFLGWLDELAQQGEDMQGIPPDADAVTTCTYHRAKGLEWPVCVLFQLEQPLRYQTLGVQVQSDGEAVDLADPLRGLWIRYWPSPYHPTQRTTPFHRRVAAHPADAEARTREEKQLLRLLYVGWTRARDRLVLAGPGGLFLERDGMLALLNDGERPLLSRPALATEWAGQSVVVRTRRAGVSHRERPTPQPGALYVQAGERPFEPYSLAPSSVDERGRCVGVTRLGDGLNVTATVSPTDLGEALHNYFAVDFRLDDAERISVAAGLLRRWGVDAALTAPDLVRLGRQLRVHLASRWPAAELLSEVPLTYRLPSTTLVFGTVDLMLRLESGVVLIDHKCIVASQADAREMACAYAGQLACYAAGIAEAGSLPVLATLIHLPFSGELLAIVRGPQPAVQQALAF